MARTKIRGLAELEVKLKRKIPEAAKKAARDSLTKGAGEMAVLMKSLAPEDDGDLSDSIAVTGPGQTTPPYSQPGGSRTAGEMQALVTAGNSKVRYAHLVEFDTAPHVLGGKFKGAQHPGTDAQPFFFPAYRALRKRAKGRITRAINKAIREAFGKGGKKV